VEKISLQEFGFLSVFIVAIATLFKLLITMQKQQLCDRDAEFAIVRREKDKQIDDLRVELKECQARNIDLNAALRKSVEVTGRLTDTTESAVKIAEKKAAQ
jgi:uncharacterized protein YjaG (DUF416 family)